MQQSKFTETQCVSILKEVDVGRRINSGNDCRPNSVASCKPGRHTDVHQL